MHSYRDMGLRVIDRAIGNPAKIKRKERVPYSNIVYDFSGIYGGQEYEERELIYTFEVKSMDKIKLNMLENMVNNWLMRPNEKIKLIDDYVKGFYFMAEVEDAINYEELTFSGRFTVTFKAYSFKISEELEGSDIWDEFNFLLDYAQDVAFEVNGSKSVTLYNGGVTAAKPVVVASAAMQVVVNGKSFDIPVGRSSHNELVLIKEETNLTITGSGTIKFEFRKEVI